MTKFQKQMLTIAAAGALTAVTALPALAFENEFHGSFTFNSVFGNLGGGYGAAFNPGSATWKDKRKMDNFNETRTRIQYIGKASDDLKLVTHFEINTRFGAQNNLYGTAANVDAAGGDLDGDGLNIVTKHAYLDFNIGKSFNAKLGLQPYKDTLKGIFIDADVPAVMGTAKLGAYTLGLGFTRYNDAYTRQGGLTIANGNSVTTNTRTTDRLGDLNTDLVILDNKFDFSKTTKAALSYYFLSDYTSTNSTTKVHTFGLSGETKVGPVDLSGFAAYQIGKSKTPSHATIQAYAANLGAKMKAGSGTAKTSLLFVSGANNDNTAFNHAWQQTGVSSFNEGGMMLMVRNTYHAPTSANTFLRQTISNIALASVGYDANLTDKFSVNTNVGFGWAPSSRASDNYDRRIGATAAASNGSDFLGTEINVEAGYKLYKNLNLLAQGGYMILGGYYKNSTYNHGGTATTNAATPENPYVMKLQARYSF